MNSAWQSSIVLVAVMLAASYLARLAWLSIVARRAAACGGCDKCSASADQPAALVTLTSHVQSGEVTSR
jgi:hypothetical protein